MWQGRKWRIVGWFLMLIVVFSLAACSNGEVATTEETAEPAGDADSDMMGGMSEEMDEHNEADEMAGEHAEEGHAIPEEAAALENPVEVSEASVETGATLFSENCAICHGTEGRGDGPTAETLDPPPADLHADHVQILTDGELFWVITHGVEGTGMPAWEDTLTEEERWDIVNFIRTFKE